MRNEILIVQPDQGQRAAIRAVLESHGHAVSEANCSDTADALLQSTAPDAVLLQWSSSADARKFLERVTQPDGSTETCAIVTAREAEFADALSALDMGFDDCVRIPAGETELVARVNAALRRRFGRNSNQIAVGPLLLDKNVHCLCIDGKPVPLAPTEFRLLSFFLENPGRVFSRDEILKGAWQRNITAGSRTVDVHVRRLRQILEPHRCDDMIQTVRSFGYRFRDQTQA